MHSSTNSSAIAFFGATGGCALACLARCLEAGFDCRALARTPSKLEKMLLARGVSTATLASHLTISRATPKMSKTFPRCSRFQSHSSSSASASAAPKFSLNPLNPVSMDDPNVCASSMSTILAALSRLPSTTPSPLIATISTTGLSTSPVNDVPSLLTPLYKWGLHVPHIDKQAMEDVLIASGRDYVIVKPSLLMDGGAKAGKEVRVGWEGGAVKKGTNKVGAAVGMTVGREDVGRWLFEQLVRRGEEGKREWQRRKVTITY